MGQVGANQARGDTLDGVANQAGSLLRLDYENLESYTTGVLTITGSTINLSSQRKSFGKRG